MGIQQARSASAGQATPPVTTIQPGGGRLAEDRITTDAAARLRSALASAAVEASTARGDLLHLVEVAVQAGSYYPDPRKIGQRLLEEIEIAARVQAVLAK